jgi:hypothetical protein
MDIHAPQGPELELVMDRLHDAGIGWAHVALVWPYVESARGVYDWSVYDAIVAAAQARKIDVLATIVYTPAWATSDPTWAGVPDAVAWADFCGQAARRYKGKIDHWGLWNEPNLAKFWSGTRQQYIDIVLGPGADAIHAANPRAQVGGPALAHLDKARWYDWLDDVLVQAGDRLDFAIHHIYDTAGNRRETSRLNDPTDFGGLPNLWSLLTPSVREVVQHAGWLGRPFWLTETGWQTDVVGDDLQASDYAGMLSDWFTGYPGQTWIDKIFFYEMLDFPPNGSTWGILRADGTPKPAWFAYRDFIAAEPLPASDNAQLVAANLPDAIDSGESVTVSLTFRNTGATTWTAAAGYKLGAARDRDSFALPRQELAAAESVAPGGQKTFSFELAAPAAAGLYVTRWQMLREGHAWFGDLLSQRVTVRPALPAAARRCRRPHAGNRGSRCP